MERDEAVTVAINMQKYGGSFVRSLGQALSYADWSNIEKIKIAFPEYWEQYLNFENKENENEQFKR